MVRGFLASTLSRAAKYAALAATFVGSVGLAGWSAYLSRGDWYADHGSSQAILITVGVATMASFLTFASLFDPQRRKRPISWLVPAAVMLGCLLVFAVRWFYPWPTLADARAAFEAGEIDRARVELDALVVRRPDTPGVAELRLEVERASTGLRAERDEASANSADDHRLDQVGNGTLAIDATLVLRRTWTDPAKQETARQRVLERARAMADADWKRGDGASLARIAADTAGLDAAFIEQTEHRAALAWARTCLDEHRLDCVHEALAKLDEGQPIEATLEELRVTIAAELQAVEASGDAREELPR